MKFFTLSFLLTAALSLTAPAAAFAGPFTSPFVKHGVTDPRIAAYMPKFAKRPHPPFWRPSWRPGRYLCYPYNDCCQNSTQDRDRPSPPPKPVYQESIELNPQIFNPAPKTPLTLVIQDGVVVETYRGY